VGVNFSLSIGNLLTLKYTDLHLKERSLKLTEAKTAKQKNIRLTILSIESIDVAGANYR
jgi:hypothetical protein